MSYKKFFVNLCSGILLAMSLVGCAERLPSPLPPEESTIQPPSSMPQTESTAPLPSPAPTESTPSPTDPVEIKLQSMSLREKVGQLFIIRPDALDFSLTQKEIDDPKRDGAKLLSEEMVAALHQYPAGGVVIFGKNLSSPEQITTLNASLQEHSETPMFLCIDEEGGLVSRLANHENFVLPKYESAAAIGRSGTPSEARKMGEVIGSYLHEYGFNLDFAPVADVSTNPKNPIGTRAFSSDADSVALFAGAMADGLRSQGIIPVFKHFPGHGNTAEDSHTGLAVTHKTKEELETCEWIPFIHAKNTDGIMVGHISVPEITGNEMPATLSKQIVNDLLKGQLGFEGIVVTDSLVMEAITDSYSPGEAALTALSAGCDLLLMPNEYCLTFDAIVNAVENGQWSEEDLNETVRKILNCKYEHGIW